MSVQIVGQGGAQEQGYAKNMTWQAKPVFGKRREQDDNEKRDDEDTQERQAVWKIHTGHASEYKALNAKERVVVAV